MNANIQGCFIIQIVLSERLLVSIYRDLHDLSHHGNWGNFQRADSVYPALD